MRDVRLYAVLQFVQRVLIMFMPAKYQPDYMYLRHVPVRRVHLFTAIQIVCLIGLWIVKTIKQISIIFPLMVRIVGFHGRSAVMLALRCLLRYISSLTDFCLFLHCIIVVAVVVKKVVLIFTHDLCNDCLLHFVQHNRSHVL